MTIAEMQQEIIRLKKEKDVCILAHSYQAREICEIADYTGDSYKLSVDAAKVNNQTILMCGQMDRALISQVKETLPDYTIVAYINTTAELKTICDVCVTSSSAVEICKKIENDKILFIPDCNLGAFVASQVSEKTFKLLSGGCPIHACVNTDDVRKARELYPDAELLVHPECTPDVAAMADYIGSTSGIMNYAIKSDKKEFIIGTEISIAEHLQYMCPDKKFHYLSLKLICPNMKATTLVDLYDCLNGTAGEEIVLDDDTMRDARKCIDEMIRLG